MAARPKMTNLLRMVNRARQRLRPSDPVDLDFELDLNFIPDDFLKADIDVEGQRHLLFATEHQLYILSRAKTWYLDSTFKVVKDPFVQMLSIHAFIRSGEEVKQVPLAFCLMSRRRSADYSKVLKKLIRKLPTAPRVQVVVTDFEAAVWKSVRTVIPGVEVRGCAFHWAQAVNRKVSELGLQTAYRNNDDLHSFVRLILSLNFVPADHITPAYRYLRQKTTSPVLIELLHYVRDTWINSQVWTKESWSMYLQPIRTNNDVEGWHRRLNVKANDTKPAMYVLISLLHKEASLLPIQGKMVCEGKLSRRYRAQVSSMQGKLFSLWDKYEEDQISSSQLMRACGKLYSV